MLTSDGAAYGWGVIKLLGATLPPGYPGELCTASPTEIGHNRFAQPISQTLNPGVPFSAIVDGYVDFLGVRRGGAVLSCRPVVSKEQGAAMSEVADLPGQAVQVALTESSGFAFYADGSVWSWGMHANGQLGRAMHERFEGPAQFIGLQPMSALAAGNGDVLALDRSGKVWSWGANGAGQLGTGSLSESHKPVKVALPARIKRIGAGDTHSFAVDDMGKLWGWGANNFGQVGEALNPAFSTAYYTVPHRIKTGFSVALIDAGMFYTVATSAQGDVFAWGWNGMAQLGQESLASSPVPQPIKQLGNVTRLAAGVSHVLAASNAGVFAWGDNRSSACSAFPSVAVQLKPLLVNFA